MSSLGRLACILRNSASDRSPIGRSEARRVPETGAEGCRSPSEAGGAIEPSAGMACRTVAMLHYRPLVFAEDQSLRSPDDHWHFMEQSAFSAPNDPTGTCSSKTLPNVFHITSSTCSTSHPEVQKREPNVEEPEVQNGEIYAEKPLFCCTGRGGCRWH